MRNPEALKEVERYTILSAIDKLWQEHLYEMDSLRYSIGLRAHGQRDPLIEYKAEAFKIFDELMVNIKTEICHNIFRSASSLMAFENFLRNAPQQTLHQNTSAFGGTSTGTSGGATGKASDVVSEAAAAGGKSQACPHRPESRPQRPVPLRQRQEIQAVLREVTGRLRIVHRLPSPRPAPSGRKFPPKRSSGIEPNAAGRARHRALHPRLSSRTARAALSGSTWRFMIHILLR